MLNCANFPAPFCVTEKGSTELVANTDNALPSALVLVTCIALFAVDVDTLILSLNVLSPAIVCVPVVIKPLAVAEASGILNVCVSTELTIAKSVPVLPTAKY